MPTQIQHFIGGKFVSGKSGRKTIASRWPTRIRAGADFVMPTMR